MKFKLSSQYGELTEVRDHAHNGIDFAMNSGTTLRTIKDGLVTKIFDGSTDIGKGVAIQTDNGNTHIFGHMSAINVHEGQSLHNGDIIGLSGNTGHSTAPHLHFGIQTPTGDFTDPTNYAAAVAGASGDNSWMMDKFNTFSDWFVGKEVEMIGIPIKNFLNESLSNIWHWFIFNLPDMMGYFTIGAGILIIISALIGNGSLLKTLGWYIGIMITALCILGGI